MNRVCYYTDEINDDFAGMNMNKKPLPEKYDYVKKTPVRTAVFRFFAAPIAYLTCKLHYGIKYVNRKAVKDCKTGYFLYINHTMTAGDAFNPNMIAFPKKTNIIVGREAVSKWSPQKISRSTSTYRWITPLKAR